MTLRGLFGSGLLALSLSFGLLGCAPEQPQKTTLNVPVGTADFVGRVSIPTELISNNTGGLISNNTGGLISNNTGGYRITALAEEPLKSALVYLLNPDEQFYNNLDGDRIVATTDAKGEYRLPSALPSGKQVIVSALLSGNRRMVGYTFSQAGENRVDVSIATTYVTEFLRAQAAKAGRTMGDYPEALAKLPALVTETQKLLDDGSLPIPDLTIGQAGAMNQRYLAVFGSRSKALSDRWAELLGRRVVALSTAGGTYAIGTNQEDATGAVGLHLPTGVAMDAAGNLFVAEKNSHGIRWIKPDGTSAFIGGFRGDGSITVPTLDAHDKPFASTLIPQPWDVACDPDGNVIVALQGRQGANEGIVFLCRKAGTYFGLAMQTNRSYVLGSPAGETGHAGGTLAGATFNAVSGVTTDEAGNIYLADRRNNLIRRIARQTGLVTVVAGLESFDPDGFSTIPDDAQSRYATAEQAAFGAVIHRPFDVTWAKGSDGRDRLYVWEGNNPTEASASITALGNAIREIAFDAADPASGSIRFLMGGTPAKLGFGGDGGPASDALLALVKADLDRPEVPYGGIAVSKDGRHLFFSDALNRRVRVIDLSTGIVETVAGGGTKEGDAEAREALVKDVSGLAIGPDGALYFSDTLNQVVRKLNLQFGR